MCRSGDELDKKEEKMQRYSEISWFYEGLIYLCLGILVLLVSRVVIEKLTPYKVANELVKLDNPALGVTLTGYYAGVIIIFLGAVIGEADYQNLTGFFGEVLSDLLYALFGILLLNGCRLVVDKLILYKFSMEKEIISDRNIGTGAVESGSMIATALMIGGAIHGEGSFLSAVVFFVLGQLLLILFGMFHQYVTPYDIHDEIEKDNVAAGAYMGFSMVALGVIVLKATSGDFVGWIYNLSYFAMYSLVGLLLLSLLQKLTMYLFLSGACLEEEIANDQNMNIAWIGGVLSVGIASMFFFLL